MRTNGYLKISILSGGGTNKKGEPIKSEETWSDPIPCFIKANTHNNKGKYEDGKFTVASYTILVSAGSCSLSVSKVSLSLDGEELGEFHVQHIQALKTVGRIQITV